MKQKSSLTEATFKSIYDRLAPRLVAFAKSWSGDKVFAEDLVQDAFVKIWQRRDSINEIEKIDHLLYTMVRNNLINHHQKKLKEKAYLSTISNEPDVEPDAQHTLKKIQLLNRHLDALPPKSKQVFLMSRKEGLTYREIASELSISTKSVEKHISKALKILRKRVKQVCMFFL